MYFNQFESYQQALEGTRSVAIDVMMTDGTVVQSSAIPIVALDQVLEDIAGFWETKSTLAIWKWASTDPTIVMVAHDHVKSVSIRLIAR